MLRRTFGVLLIEHQYSAYWIDTDIIWSISPAHAILTYARPDRLTWAVSEEAVRPYTWKALLQFAKTRICGLRLKKIETKQFIHYVTLASIMSHQLELGDYKVKMQILFSLHMVNSTHNMVYGAFSSTATEELLLCTYDSNICNRCLKRYVKYTRILQQVFFNCT